MITNHLPEPTFEGAVQGQEQIFQVDAWGKNRMVVCKSAKGFFSTN